MTHDEHKLRMVREDLHKLGYTQIQSSAIIGLMREYGELVARPLENELARTAHGPEQIVYFTSDKQN